MVLTDVLLLNLEELLDLVANLTVRELDIILGVAVVVHEGEEAIVGDVELMNVSMALHYKDNSDSQAGTHDGRRGERPCCGWRERDLRTSWR